jgi:hypothetical protein
VVELRPTTTFCLATGLLGGHVVGRPHHLPGAGQAGGVWDCPDHFRQTKVGDLHSPLGINQDVLRLDLFFLLQSLKNFLSTERRRHTALKRGGGRHVLPLDFESGEDRYRLELADTETVSTPEEHQSRETS